MLEGSRINLVVAHPAEARPLCAMFAMRAHSLQSPFPLFQNQDGLCLIVSGMGKLSAAAATAWLAGLQAQRPTCAWLNIGIAGHRHAAIGTGLLAHKITNAGSKENFYPPQLFHGLPATAVVTVDVPEQNYPEDAAYDMEAAGYYPSASRVATTELVHAFKIISDNPQHPVARFDVAQVQHLIKGQQAHLESLLDQLGTLLEKYRAVYVAPMEYEELLARYHLTVSQRLQLKRLCERMHALNLKRELETIGANTFTTGKELLFALEQCVSGRADN